jgi:hypothetical protein
VELSALRESELAELVEALPNLDLSDFAYVSFHAPSSLSHCTETEVLGLLSRVMGMGIPIIVHPDIITNWAAWRSFRSLLCIENMDKRKPLGRTTIELESILGNLPEASMCLDLGHARQVDPTMSEAAEMLRVFGTRVSQLHVSEVNTSSRHDHLTVGALLAFNKVSHLIPDDIPVVLESRVSEDEVEREVALARKALPVQNADGVLVA